MKRKDGEFFLAENTIQRTGEDFGVDLSASPVEIQSSRSPNKKKKVGKKKSLIAPLDHPQVEPQQMIEQLGIGLDDQEDENKWDFPMIQLDADRKRANYSAERQFL